MLIFVEHLKGFINSKFKEQTDFIQRALTSERQRLKYDLNKFMDEVKNTFLINAAVTNPPQSTASAIETLGIELPLKNLNDFETFDADLKISASKYNALVNMYTI